MAAEKKIDSQFYAATAAQWAASPVMRCRFSLADPINFRAGRPVTIPTLFVSLVRKLNVFIGPRNAVLSFSDHAARGSVFFVFNPTALPCSSRNGFVFLESKRRPSRALLPTSG